MKRYEQRPDSSCDNFSDVPFIVLRNEVFLQVKCKKYWLYNVQKLLIFIVLLNDGDVIVLVILPWSWHIHYIVQIPSANGKHPKVVSGRNLSKPADQ